MLIRTGLWSLEAAKSWLRNYEWGQAIASKIEENPEPPREEAWICMVMDMEALVSDSDPNRSPEMSSSSVENDALLDLTN